jgi:hypothetical protein
MCCCTERFIVHWIQGHTKPNHHCQQPLPLPTQAILPLQNGTIKCRTCSCPV